jgi:hypothetical protein
MRKLLIPLFTLLVLGGSIAPPAAAVEVIYLQQGKHLSGIKNRRDLRHQLYAKRLVGDKLAVFEEHGFTPYRLREDRGGGEVIERWRYPELGREYRFDAASRLIAVRKTEPGDRVFD